MRDTFFFQGQAESRLIRLMPPDDAVPPPRLPTTPETGTERTPEAVPAEVRPAEETPRRVEAVSKELSAVAVDRQDPSVFTSGGGINRLWWQNKPGATEAHYKIMHQAHLSWQANINRVQPRTPQQWETFKASEVARMNPQLAPHGIRVFSYPGIPALGWEVINAGAAGVPDNLQGPLNEMMSPQLNTGPNIMNMGPRLTIIIAILIALLVLIKLAEEGRLGRDGRRREDGPRPDGDRTPEGPRNPVRDRVREEMRTKKLNLDGLKGEKEKKVKSNNAAIAVHQKEIKSLRASEDKLGSRRKPLQDQIAKLEREGAEPTNAELVRAKAELEQIDRDMTSSRTRRETLEKDVKRMEDENKTLQEDIKAIDEMKAEGRDAIDRSVRLTNFMIERLPEAVRKNTGGFEITAEGAILLKEPVGELHRLLAPAGQPPLAAGVTVQLAQVQEAHDRMPR